MASERRTGLGTASAGLLRPTAARPDPEPESPAEAEPEPRQSRGAAEAEQPEPAPEPKGPSGRNGRKSKVEAKAATGGVSGRKLYLPEDIHFRLRMLAYQRNQKLSETAAEVLDKALPRWNVERTG